MTYEKDSIWGTQARRRAVAHTRQADARPYQGGVPAGHAPGGYPVQPPPENSATGPEAVERAQWMAYERMTQIQQESPYIREEVEVVEHRVHDYRLYVGMWLVAGASGVAAFLTFSLVHLLITALAVALALLSTPGRQYED